VVQLLRIMRTALPRTIIVASVTMTPTIVIPLSRTNVYKHEL